MKHFTFLLVAFCLYQTAIAQGSYTGIFTDSLGRETTWEAHWGQVYTGRYKSTFNKAEKKNILVRTTDTEFQEELQNTRELITKKSPVGTDMPVFKLSDINGNEISSTDIKGKVIVMNFWYIDCPPCEMEHPSLNELRESYADNNNVVFLSFTTDQQADVKTHLQKSPFLYEIISTSKTFIKNNFDIKVCPESFIIDKGGKYSFHSSGTGIGIKQILQQEIDKALEGSGNYTQQQPNDTSTAPPSEN